MTINEDGFEWSIENDLEFSYGSSCSGYFSYFYFIIGGYKNCTTNEESFNDIRYFLICDKSKKQCNFEPSIYPVFTMRLLKIKVKVQ